MTSRAAAVRCLSRVVIWSTALRSGSKALHASSPSSFPDSSFLFAAASVASAADSTTQLCHVTASDSQEIN